MVKHYVRAIKPRAGSVDHMGRVRPDLPAGESIRSERVSSVPIASQILFSVMGQNSFLKLLYICSTF